MGFGLRQNFPEYNVKNICLVKHLQVVATAKLLHYEVCKRFVTVQGYYVTLFIYLLLNIPQTDFTSKQPTVLMFHREFL